MKRWIIYAGTSALIVGLSALLIGLQFEPPARYGVWAGLAAAWLVQAAAFAILIAATRRRAQLVFAGWTAGTFLRFLVLGLGAWLTLGGILGVPAEPTLLSLVIAMFALLLLEPVVFRRKLGVR
ncbi:MAG: hypothetical protein JSW46_13930 [Gemmatimonadota bacterium]|nr:MAG: hypothetical protein JSW46_13930 [Gemmatimonadota bacterium]